MVMQKNHRLCPNCGGERHRQSKRCRSCYLKNGNTLEENARLSEAMKKCVPYQRTAALNDAMSSRLTGHPKPWIQGNRHHNWKGGTSPVRQRLYVSAEVKEFLKATYRRDNYRCQRCGRGKTVRKGLHVHHFRSWAQNPELRFDPSNVVTLCKFCHEWVHSNENVNREYIVD